MSLQKVLDTNSTQSAFTLAADVVHAVVDTAAIKAVKVGASLAAVLTFTGTGADNTTFSCRIYGEYPVAGTNGETTTESFRFLLGTADCTLGANVGPANGSVIPSSDRIVDTLVWTPSAFLLAAEGAFNEGTSAAHSPADDTMAALFLPCMARCARIVPEFDMTGATSGNVQISTHDL